MFRHTPRHFRLSLSLSCGLSLIVAAGCASDTRPAAVPVAAQYEAGGPDRLVYVAPFSGTLYLTDHSSNALIYSGPVLQGDRIVVDPVANRVTIDGQVVVSRDLSHDDHRIYLLPGTMPPTPALSSATIAVKRPTGVAPDARLAAEGRERLEFTASDSGVVWLTDATLNQIVYRTAVAPGDRILVDPAKNTLTVNGAPAFKGTLRLDDYCIFFSPSASVPPVPPPTATATAGPALPPVPAGAVVMNEGTARSVFTATQPGTVWVTDTTTGRTVFSGTMHQRDTLIVDPLAGQISLNGNEVLPPGAVLTQYRVSFLPNTGS